MLTQRGDAFREATQWSLQCLKPVSEVDSYFSYYLRNLRENGHAGSDPQNVVQILDKMVADDGFPVHSRGLLRELLDVVKDAAPDTAADNRFQRLYDIAFH